jgi:hypothetical protein
LYNVYAGIVHLLVNSNTWLENLELFLIQAFANVNTIHTPSIG